MILVGLLCFLDFSFHLCGKNSDIPQKTCIELKLFTFCVYDTDHLRKNNLKRFLSSQSQELLEDLLITSSYTSYLALGN